MTLVFLQLSTKLGHEWHFCYTNKWHKNHKAQEEENLLKSGSFSHVDMKLLLHICFGHSLISLVTV